MRLFKGASLQRKQMAILMLTTSIALLIACAGFTIYEVASFRNATIEHLGTLADVIGNQAAAALDFDDPKTAGELLEALAAEENIVGACIYTPNGQVFAEYDRPGDQHDFKLPMHKLTEGTHSWRNELMLLRSIRSRGKTIGAIYLSADPRPLYDKLSRYVIIVAGVFTLTWLAAFLLSGRLQKVISKPILELVSAADNVARSQDYSIRAARGSGDEIGVLIDRFNGMLEQIQERDSGLHRVYAELELRVAERTGELANMVALLHATLESTADGILVVDASGEVANYNEQFLKIWNIPQEVAEKKNRPLLREFVLPLMKNPEPFAARTAEIEMVAESHSNDLVELKDGRVFERCSKPQRVGDKCVGRVWSYHEITERKESEARLETMYKQLLDASRMAGMAEVATSVLHNVGNVLNSVNVSSSVLSDRVRKSRVGNLFKVVDLLKEHEGDLPGFFARNARGAQLCRYLGELASHLTEEQKENLEELRLLGSNIEHIKEIVAMQQSYSKVSGVTQRLSVVELVEDALQMNAGSIERHQIQVIREFSEIPIVTLDKHKVLQVLINLIRNAKYACDETNLPDKRMTVRVERTREKHVRISIIDNGIGIPRENLTRIFSHGFTTKKDGHGFGLHSGALGAKEMGGSLTVHSDGVGKGAAFVLDFPCEDMADEPDDE